MAISISISITPAKIGDEKSILEIMRPWNMHRVPSPEMDALDMQNFFVATVENTIVGAAGYKLLRPAVGKTTLLSVLPQFSKNGIGRRLHHERCIAMYRLGVRKVITNSDLPNTIAWYQKHYDYKIVGMLKKVSSFGSENIDHWTTMEMCLETYMRKFESNI